MSPAWDGTQYHNNSLMQAETAKVALQDTQLQGKILDIGCGSGAVSAYMAHRVSESGTVLGIDNAESMIAFAKKEFKDVSNLSFEFADAMAWAFTPEEFNMITSFSCLHWIKDLPPVINNIGLSLKKGGQFIACLSPYSHFLYQPLLDVSSSAKWAGYFKNPKQKPWYPWEIHEFKELLKNAELAPEEIYIWNKMTTSKSRNHFIAFLKGWIMAVPHLTELPTDKSDMFIEDVADDFLKTITIKPNGSFEYVTPYLMARAKKPVNNEIAQQREFE